MTPYWDSTGGSQTALDELDRRAGDAGPNPALLNIFWEKTMLTHPTAKGTETARKAVATKFILGKFRERFFEGTKAITGAVPTPEAEFEYSLALKRTKKMRKGLASKGYALEGGFYLLEMFLIEYFEELKVLAIH